MGIQNKLEAINITHKTLTNSVPAIVKGLFAKEVKGVGEDRACSLDQIKDSRPDLLAGCQQGLASQSLPLLSPMGCSHPGHVVQQLKPDM